MACAMHWIRGTNRSVDAGVLSGSYARSKEEPAPAANGSRYAPKASRTEGVRDIALFIDESWGRSDNNAVAKPKVSLSKPDCCQPTSHRRIGIPQYL
jgi:hypothetical protein